MQSLGDDDKEGIAQTINQEVLKGTPITFSPPRSAPTATIASTSPATSSSSSGVEPDRLRSHRHRRRPGHRQRDRQADRVGHEAVLGAVRDAEGHRRGRRRDRRQAAYRLTGGARRAPRSRRRRASVAVDRLRVEAALDAGRQRAGAVGVHGDVGDRPRLRRRRSPALNTPFVPAQRLGRGSSAIPASSRALARILLGRARDRRRGAVSTGWC